MTWYSIVGFEVKKRIRNLTIKYMILEILEINIRNILILEINIKTF